MNDVEKLFHDELKRSTFSEAVSDNDYDVIDNLIDEPDDQSSESEEI